ncbi:MAG TPA: FlgD immunoglobulin-like domain containing protein [Candidatus Limnocylindria bacterium]|nr:FlgD immunoglobulin-like domain containing protein [Candidatus Limnocylindria bacterium]
MFVPRPLLWSLPALLAFLVSPLHAFTPPASAPNAAIPLRGGGTPVATPSQQRALEASPGWRAFVADHGSWTALWNAGTGSPHRAFGPAIALAGFRDDPAGVDQAVRRFIASQPAVFGTGVQLETAGIVKARGLWYVHYRQTLSGLPVLFADWEFRVGVDGRLMAFGIDAHRVDPGSIRKPTLVPAAARVAAVSGLSFDAGRDRIEGAERVFLLPRIMEQGLEYRPVFDVRVHTVDPPGNWITLVDAETGEVLWRQDRVRYAIQGTVTGLVHPTIPTEPVVSRPFPHLRVNVGPTPATTNASGAYSAAAAGTVTVSAQLSGSFCDVNRQDAADASFSTSASDPATVDIAWGPPSHEAERDGYLHVTLAHEHAKAIDPGFTGNDYPMPCAVNIASTCNAFWDGTGVNFFLAGGGCPNTATMPDVVYHEYGHGVNDNLYVQAGAPQGLNNGALHEGMADVYAALLQDDPNVGKGFFGVGTVLRSIDNTARWPENRSGDPHITGLIIGGAFWDLRQAVGLAVARQLSHFSKYGTPDDLNDGVAMSEFFIEALVADDDDANLGNGTPHDNEIVAAFNAHGIGTVFFTSITHVPLADQTGPGPYTVTATIQYTAAIGAIDPATATLHYRVNGGSFVTVPLTPTGNPNEYSAQIPGQSGAIVRYYLSVEDTFGEQSTSPSRAPAEATHVFLAGTTTNLLAHDLETNPGWVAGATGDGAISGVWTRVNPLGTFQGGEPVQPEDDHTAAGTMCFITGQHTAGQGVGFNDVDAGQTTLTTAAFDATGTPAPLIEFWRWYTNDLGGSPGEDVWRVDISSDGGGNWTSVENTSASENSWRRIVLLVSDHVTPTNNMKLRFIAEDAGAGSLVEAGVDDFRLFHFDQQVAVGETEPASDLALSSATPNPFSTTTWLRFRLSSAGRAELRIYDVNGRLVRSLAEGAREAGEHAVAWDGRDQSGRVVPSGSYFARLALGDREVVRTVVRMR